jgi:hopanoid C-3 methylase
VGSGSLQPAEMRALLLRPAPENERFGLGPFFRVEPLGLEYLAAALRSRNHDVAVADLRFEKLEPLLRRERPDWVGIGCTHALDAPAVASLAREIKRHAPDVPTIVGGHAAALDPGSLLVAGVEAVCTEDAEATFGGLADGLASGRPLATIPGLALRGADGELMRTEAAAGASLDAIPLPARDTVARFRRRYHCVHKLNVFAVETARGCPFRCSFCSVPARYGRSLQTRAIDWVCRDFAEVGDHVFVVDDLFFHPAERSLELARALAADRLRKRWMLVQTRVDLVARRPDLLAAWRPLSEEIDLFFGFEAPTDQGLEALDKDFGIADLEQGIARARELGFGITGNFVVDPGWTERDFHALWQLVDRLSLRRVGYTVLTPMPGTPLFSESSPRIVEHNRSRYDMHHAIVEPRLGRQRFFELFAETWRRNVLGHDSARSWWRWLRGVPPARAGLLLASLWRTQRLFRASAYLAESPAVLPARIDRD